MKNWGLLKNIKDTPHTFADIRFLSTFQGLQHNINALKPILYWEHLNRPAY